MACHEIAALRLGLHTLLGSRPDHERSHELAELGEVLDRGGALAALAGATTLGALRDALAAAALELEGRVAEMGPETPNLGYHRALLVTVHSTQRSLDRISADIERFYMDIEDTHDLLHETFPDGD